MKKIISKNGHGEIVEKKSRFISELVHVNSSEEAMNVVAEIKKKHFDARHNCYAYVCGPSGEQTRYSDDGEPGGTAGLPLLNLLESNDLTDALVVVTRYFGGTLLGTGGLVRAYRGAGEAAMEDAVAAVQVDASKILIPLDFKDENSFRRIVRSFSEKGKMIEITDVTYSTACNITIVCENDILEELDSVITSTFSGSVSPEKVENTFMYKNI